MSDFRVRFGFLSHPKTEKLKRWAGADAVLAFLQLWEFCAQTPGRENGDLRGMQVDDIEIAARWRGAEGALVDGLRRVRYLDELPGGGFAIHQFAEHNEFVASRPDASENGRAGNHYRWHVGRDIYDPTCEYCIASSPPIRPDSPPESRGESSTPPPNQPTNQPTTPPDGHRPDSPGDLAPVALGSAPAPSPWRPGEVIATSGDFEAALGVAQLKAGNLKSEDRKRAKAIIDAGPIEPDEWDEAVTAAKEKAQPKSRVSFALGRIELIRERVNEQLSKPRSGPSRANAAWRKMTALLKNANAFAEKCDDPALAAVVRKMGGAHALARMNAKVLEAKKPEFRERYDGMVNNTRS